MPNDDMREVAVMASAAAGMGGATRLAMALHGGMRSPLMLAFETFLGGTLGVIAAAAAVWYDPALRDIGWPLLIVAGTAGAAGALGTRVMDMVQAALQAWLKKKLGVK